MKGTREFNVHAGMEFLIPISIYKRQYKWDGQPERFIKPWLPSGTHKQGYYVRLNSCAGRRLATLSVNITDLTEHCTPVLSISISAYSRQDRHT